MAQLAEHTVGAPDVHDAASSQQVLWMSDIARVASCVQRPAICLGVAPYAARAAGQSSVADSAWQSEVNARPSPVCHGMHCDIIPENCASISRPVIDGLSPHCVLYVRSVA